jgi:MarR family transcriptional regulator, organic hydroperoxide resistance regulator
VDRRQQVADLMDNFRAVSKGMAKLGPSFLNDINITYTQMMILCIVKEHEGISVKKLAGTMGITSSAATQQVNTLVSRGYLLRQESSVDRRLVSIRPSGEMAKQVEAMKSKFLDQVSPLFDRLTDEELAQYCNLTSKVSLQMLQD